MPFQTNSTLSVSIYVDGVLAGQTDGGKISNDVTTLFPPPVFIAAGGTHRFSVVARAMLNSKEYYLSARAQDVICTVSPISSGTFI